MIKHQKDDMRDFCLHSLLEGQKAEVKARLRVGG